MKKQFIAVIYNDNYNENVLADLYKDKRIITLDGITKKRPKNFLQNMLYKIQFSRLSNMILDFPFKRKIWGLTLDDIEWNTDTEYYLMITNPGGIPTGYLNRLKKYNVKYIMKISEPIDTNGLYNRYLRRFLREVSIDYIFTSNARNAEKCSNMMYEPFPVYSMLSDNTPVSIDYDLYLIARNLGNRMDKFYAVFEYLRQHNVDMQFKLNGVKESDRKFENEILFFDTEMPYASVVEEVKKTNCILEIIRDDYTTMTLRYCEAVCYNKKLLTNNKNATNLPFYNPEYIHIFEKPKDIDYEWVKERIPIDYGYDGRFSPSYLFDKVMKLEKEKEGQVCDKK